MSKSILLIEDNEEEQKIFASYLEFVGGAITTASSGEEGCRLAKRQRPDLILLDLRLPGMNGWEVRQRLAEDPATAAIPVLVITGLRLPREQWEEGGFCGYLEKPVAPYRVLQEVERCLGQLGWEPVEEPESPHDPEPGGVALRALGSVNPGPASDPLHSGDRQP